MSANTQAHDAFVIGASTNKPTSKATRSHNQAMPSDAVAKSQASLAFKEDSDGRALVGTAEQRMTYALEIHMAQDATRKSDLPKLDCTSDEDKRTLKQHVTQFFCGDAPDKKALIKEKGSIVAAETIKKHNAMKALVMKALKYAIILNEYGIDWKWYDVERNCLRVKPVMITPKDCTPIGRLATDSMISLDNRSIVFLKKAEDGSETPDHASANITHMLACLKKEKEEERTPQQKAIESAKPETLAKYCDIASLIAALKIKLVDERPSEPLIAIALTNEVWSGVSSIVQVIDEAIMGKDFLLSQDGITVPAAAVAMHKAKAA